MTFDQEMIRLLEDLLDSRLRAVLVGCIARIEKHDLATMRADVKPLLRFTATGETKASEYAVIPGIPVQFIFAGGFFIRPEYKAGDLVWVSFSTHDIGSGLYGEIDSDDGAIFSKESAAVVSGIAPTKWEAPADISEPGLLIGHADGATLIQLTADKIKIKGPVEITGDVKVTGEMGVSGEVKAMSETAPVGLSTHTHPTGVGPSGPSNPNT